MNYVQEFTTGNFDRDVLDASTQHPVLVDVWAAWCGPCRIVGPTIDRVAKQLQGRAVVGKLNADQHAEVVRRYQVNALPTVLVFRDRQVVSSLVGVQSEEDYIEAVRAAAETQAA